MSYNSDDFDCRVAVVTGSGIGKAIALGFLRAGTQVAGVGRHVGAPSYLRDFRGQFFWIRAGVSREVEVRRMRGTTSPTWSRTFSPEKSGHGPTWNSRSAA